jgi:hypothetical protein
MATLLKPNDKAAVLEKTKGDNCEFPRNRQIKTEFKLFCWVASELNVPREVGISLCPSFNPNSENISEIFITV